MDHGRRAEVEVVGGEEEEVGGDEEVGEEGRKG